MKNKWVLLLIGYVVGSYFGLSHLLSMFGGAKKS